MRAAIAILVLAACRAASPVPGVRFANAPPVTVVDDRRDVPVPPGKRAVYATLADYDGTFHRRISRALTVSGHRRARGVNALGEVPDSTWFTNRIGIRTLSLDELRRGPNTIESPEAHKPWRIVRYKRQGRATGFVIRDARGIEFLLKLEERGFPELETATHAIVHKLLWAIGYNVPEDFIVHVRPDELVPDPSVDRVAIGDLIARCERDSSGLRGLASRLVPGKALGGHPAEGTRAGDPNDRIPHELRRELRGAYPIFAWLDHVDVKEANTLDIWAPDRDRPDHHYVRHYLIDFGKSLGVMARHDADPRSGHAYWIDLEDMAQSLASFGLPRRTWELRTAPLIRGVGLFDARSYDPATWKPESPNYVPLLVADVHDKLWGAKLVMKFTREQLRAVVETARFSDPRAVDYVVDTLVARQRATAAYWFEQTSPLDDFRVVDSTLCFDDLSLVHALVDTPTTYAIRTFDRDGRPFASSFVLHPGAAGRTCMPLRLAAARDGYTIVEIVTARGQARRIYVHLARTPGTGTPRVIGVWRP